MDGWIDGWMDGKRGGLKTETILYDADLLIVAGTVSASELYKTKK
jgi:hypothetical protein